MRTRVSHSSDHVGLDETKDSLIFQNSIVTDARERFGRELMLSAANYRVPPAQTPGIRDQILLAVARALYNLRRHLWQRIIRKHVSHWRRQSLSVNTHEIRFGRKQRSSQGLRFEKNLRLNGAIRLE